MLPVLRAMVARRRAALAAAMQSEWCRGHTGGRHSARYQHPPRSDFGIAVRRPVLLQLCNNANQRRKF